MNPVIIWIAMKKLAWSIYLWDFALIAILPLAAEWESTSTIKILRSGGTILVWSRGRGRSWHRIQLTIYGNFLCSRKFASSISKTQLCKNGHFIEQGNWSLPEVSHLPKVTRTISNRARIWTQVCIMWTPKPRAWPPHQTAFWEIGVPISNTFPSSWHWPWMVVRPE